MDQGDQKFKEKFWTLPQDIQGALLSEDLGIEIQLIGRDTGITPEQALDVEDEVVTILMGTSHPKDFIRNIQSKLNIDQEKARTVAEKVNEEIFQPVRESLKLVHDIKDEEQSMTNSRQQSEPGLRSDLEGPLRSDLGSAPSVPTPPTVPKPPESPTAPSSFPQMIVPPKINIEMAPKPPAPPAQTQITQPPQSQNIFEQKLQGVFKMPKEETLVPQKPSSSPPPPPTPPRTGGVDPYREQPK